MEQTEEQTEDQRYGAGGTTAAAHESLRTGHPSVDAVLDSLESLDEAPVDEHVSVFERAHEQLRAALDAPPPSADPIPSALRPDS